MPQVRFLVPRSLMGGGLLVTLPYMTDLVQYEELVGDLSKMFDYRLRCLWHMMYTLEVQSSELKLFSKKI